jgi:elongation factor 1-beta
MSAEASTTAPTVEKKAEAAAAEEEEDVDLFGSDDEEEDAAKAELTRKRLEEYNAKKAAKGPKPAAKSIVTLDVKPWDDETDINQMETNVRAIEKDGLVWGASSFIEVGMLSLFFPVLLSGKDRRRRDKCG